MTASGHDIKVLAVLSRKGGSGKSTTAIHLAVAAEAAGHRTILVDTDIQGSAASWWKLRAAETPQLIEGGADKVKAVLAAQDSGIDLLVIDGRPSAERDTAELAKFADLVLIPTRAGLLDVLAIGATASVVKAAERPAAILICPGSARQRRGRRGGNGRRSTGCGGLRVGRGAAGYRRAGGVQPRVAGRADGR